MPLALSLSPCFCLLTLWFPPPAPAITIGEVQGVVEASDDPHRHQSPWLDQEVNISGVVYQTVSWEVEEGTRHGFFMQEPLELGDGNPASSDGIFVMLHGRASIDGWEPKAGDFIDLTGTVGEHYYATEIVDVKSVIPRARGLDLDRVLPPFVANPPDSKLASEQYWEMHESMRCQVPRGALVQGHAAHEFWSRDTVVYVISAEHPVAKRSNTYHRRVFRDAHPLDDIPDQLADNGNGFRFALSSWLLEKTGQEKLGGVRTFQRLQGSTGPVIYKFHEYKVAVDAPLKFLPSRLPNDLDPVPPPEPGLLSIVALNVENLYDHRDDPFDVCDAQTDEGCRDARKPFDYVPASEAEYREKLVKLADQIRGPLHSPDLLLIQEAEDQDIGRLEDGRLEIGDQNHADGRCDVLQDLILTLEAQGGKPYDTAFDRDGSDGRGITCAFLFDPARMQLVHPETNHWLLGHQPDLPLPKDHKPLDLMNHTQNPKAFNSLYLHGVFRGSNVYQQAFSRCVQVAHFNIDGQPAWILNNHFSSKPIAKVTKRQAQANLCGAIVQAIRKHEPDSLILLGGDLNTFPRPDEPIPDRPGDQLGGIYNAGMHNLYDDLLARKPESAYTYIYHGQSGTLDHIFIDKAWKNRVESFYSVHVNADFSGAASDHDPQLVRLRWNP